MKTMTKRLFALFMVLALCLSFMPAVEFSAQAATVDYVYAGNYIINWGTRGTTATSLSQNAVAFYDDNDTSYQELSQFSGSSTESGIPSSALYIALRDLMEGNHNHINSYDETKDLFQYTDCQNSGKDKKAISCFYSGADIGPEWDGGSTWNREHTWPNSKGDKAGNGENDIMMLRPTDSKKNSGRGNKAYGEGGSYYHPNEASNNVYDLRGDVARIILYSYVRWECTDTGSSYNPNGIFGTNGVFESKEVLLDWMEADPVDTWELGRNDSVESITGTRNVFVDYPELAFALFNEEVPEDYTTPSGSETVSSYSITAVSGNTAHGTVSLVGKKITATPKTGYYISGYTVVSGSATVTRNGDVFTVTASSDCTIRIDFAARTAASVTYVQNGATAEKTTGLYVGDAVTLPGYKGAEPDGSTFVGWVETQLDETEQKPSAIYLPGAKYELTAASTTFYALYSYAKEGTNTGTENWVKITSENQLREGIKLVMGCESCGAVAGSLSNKVLQKVDVDFSDSPLEFADDALVLTLGGNNDAWTFANEAGNLLGCTSTKNLAWGSGTTTWSISIDSGAATIQNTESSCGRFLYNKTSPRFTTYTSNTSSSMLLPQLYMLDSGNSVTLYSTGIYREQPTITGIAVKTLPAKTQYWVNEQLDTTGLALTVAYSDGSTETITEGYTVTGFESATAGTKTVTITYENKTASFTVTVSPYSVFDTDANGYGTLTQAITAAEEGDKLIVVQDITENVTVSKSVCVDLNGFDINGTFTIEDGCILYGMDSQTDDYTVKDAYGYGKISDTDDDIQAQDGYLMVTEADGISFHRVSLQLTSMTLRAAESGIYFKSDFAGDELVAQNVKQFGVVLSVYGVPTADNMTTDCKYSAFTDFRAGKQDAATTSTLLTGVMKADNSAAVNRQNANLSIYGRPYILTEGGQLIFGVAACRSFRQQVEAIDTMWNQLSASQKASIVQMYEKFTYIMKDWNIPNLKESVK